MPNLTYVILEGSIFRFCTLRGYCVLYFSIVIYYQFRSFYYYIFTFFTIMFLLLYFFWQMSCNCCFFLWNLSFNWFFLLHLVFQLVVFSCQIRSSYCLFFEFYLFFFCWISILNYFAFKCFSFIELFMLDFDFIVFSQPRPEVFEQANYHSNWFMLYQS